MLCNNLGYLQQMNRNIRRMCIRQVVPRHSYARDGLPVVMELQLVTQSARELEPA